MPNIFGVNFAQDLANAVAAAGGHPSITITKKTPGTRTPGQLTRGTNPTSATYSANGHMDIREVRRPDQVGASLAPVISILGATVSGDAVPEVNDEVLLEGASYLLVRLIARDSAAALYEFEAQEL